MNKKRFLKILSVMMGVQLLSTSSFAAVLNRTETATDEIKLGIQLEDSFANTVYLQVQLEGNVTLESLNWSKALASYVTTYYYNEAQNTIDLYISGKRTDNLIQLLQKELATLKVTSLKNGTSYNVTLKACKWVNEMNTEAEDFILKENDTTSFIYGSTPNLPETKPEEDKDGSSDSEDDSEDEPVTYRIKASAGLGGKITPEGSCLVKEGRNKVYKITAYPGYEIADVKVDGISMGAIDSYTFKNLKASATIEAHFIKLEEVKEDFEISPSFEDIKTHWAKEGIQFVTQKGLFSGTSSTHFSPNLPMTRGMFITVLGRLAEAPTELISDFKDVKASRYDAPYIAWGTELGIVKGIGEGQFGPDLAITREQMEVRLKNYASIKGISFKSQVEAITFQDEISINSWAKESVQVLQQAGLITGQGNGKFNPQGTATRAEVATLLYKFITTN